MILGHWKEDVYSLFFAELSLTQSDFSITPWNRTILYPSSLEWGAYIYSSTPLPEARLTPNSFIFGLS
jgi:hypothetical protein